MTPDSVELAPSAPRPLAHLFFAGLWLLSVLAFWHPLRQTLTLSLNDPRYSHLVVIPLISLFLIYWKRGALFPKSGYSPRAGLAFSLTSAALYAVSIWQALPLSNDDRLWIAVMAALFAWTAAFALCYGVRALRAAMFPVLFLLLMAPIPSDLMEKGIVILQTGSTIMAHALFKLAGVPIYRHGFVFDLPGISLEVAEECSSIHSAWALFIVSLLVGHVLLRSLWSKALLGALTVPIAVFGNAVRIFSLWYLSVHVDPGFLFGRLHHNGGILFAMLPLAILLTCAFVLRKAAPARTPAL